MDPGEHKNYVIRAETPVTDEVLQDIWENIETAWQHEEPAPPVVLKRETRLRRESWHDED